MARCLSHFAYYHKPISRNVNGKNHAASKFDISLSLFFSIQFSSFHFKLELIARHSTDIRFYFYHLLIFLLYAKTQNRI